MHSRRAFLFGISALSAAPAFAQFKRVEGAATSSPAPEEGATFRVDVNVVNVVASVRDKEGRIVGNLSREDFEILDEGKPAEITYFSQQTDLPLTLGLLVDTSMSQREVLDEERSASKQFLEQVLRPDQDQAFLIKFDVEVELLQDLTPSREKLEQALATLKTPERTLRRRFQPTDDASVSQFANPFQIGIQLPGSRGRRMPPGGRGPGGGGGRGGGSRDPRSMGIGTALYDAVYLAANDVLKNQPGRKAIVVLSDGVDFGSKVTKQSAIETALRNDSLVYGILYAAESRGGMFGGRMPDGKDTLNSLSSETGGAIFEVSGKRTLTTIYAQLQEELRNQYSIGFAPSMASGPAFRNLEVLTKNKSLKVQARTGYYPKPA